MLDLNPAFAAAPSSPYGSGPFGLQSGVKRMNLCHCQTFSQSDGHFVNDDGYCRFCGGYTPDVFRVHMGEAKLHEHIDKLGERDRLKMREIVGSGLIVDSTAERIWTSNESRALSKSG